jgi:hypothetical protein
MKGILATLFFTAEAILLIAGTVRAANGKGFLLLFAALAVMGFFFVKEGCLGNAPKH